MVFKSSNEKGQYWSPLKLEGTPCFHATPSCHVFTRGKSIDLDYKNKARWVCRSQPLMPSVGCAVTFRARMVNYSGDSADTILEDQHLPPQHTTSDVPVVRMQEFWLQAASYWFLVLEAQFRVYRIHSTVGLQVTTTDAFCQTCYHFPSSDGQIYIRKPLEYRLIRTCRWMLPNNAVVL